METAATNAKLLSEMLDNLTAPSSEEFELMKELYQSCEKLRPALFRLASETDEGDDGIGKDFSMTQCTQNILVVHVDIFICYLIQRIY